MYNVSEAEACLECLTNSREMTVAKAKNEALASRKAPNILKRLMVA